MARDMGGKKEREIFEEGIYEEVTKRPHSMDSPRLGRLRLFNACGPKIGTTTSHAYQHEANWKIGAYLEKCARPQKVLEAAEQRENQEESLMAPVGFKAKVT